MAISIPEIVLAGFLLFAFVFFQAGKRKDCRTDFFFWVNRFCAYFPDVYVIAIDANLYSDWRQMYLSIPRWLCWLRPGYSVFIIH